MLGNLSSILLFGVFFLLLFNYAFNSIDIINFIVGCRQIFSDILPAYASGLKLIRLTDFTVELNNSSLVKAVLFNATNLADDKVSASELVRSNLIVAYVKMVCCNYSNPELAHTVKRIPYLQASSQTTSWRVRSVYNELIDPLDIALREGAWNRWETLWLVVEFHPDDTPYFDPNAGLGYFYILFDVPSGARGVMLVK